VYGCDNRAAAGLGLPGRRALNPNGSGIVAQAGRKEKAMNLHIEIEKLDIPGPVYRTYGGGSYAGDDVIIKYRGRICREGAVIAETDLCDTRDEAYDEAASIKENILSYYR
jgi:hypothetical protein